MINIVIYGAPSCGKTTQAKLLSEKLNLYHINVNDILNQNKILEDDHIYDIVENQYLNVYNDLNCEGFIFDGFPKNLTQKDNLNQLLKSKKESLLIVVEVKLTDDIISERLRLKIDDDDIIDQNISKYNENKYNVLNEYKQENLLLTINGLYPIDLINSTIITEIDSRI